MSKTTVFNKHDRHELSSNSTGLERGFHEVAEIEGFWQPEMRERKRSPTFWKLDVADARHGNRFTNSINN